jgi:hypothetical protein
MSHPSLGFTPRTRSLAVECLESRRLLTVTYHGGALLKHVETQAVFYGQDWQNNAFLKQQQVPALNAFLGKLVSGSYMDMLVNAGYHVGRGSSTSGVTFPKAIDKSGFLYDSMVQRDLQTMITQHKLAAPDANRLYVVFVEPAAVISDEGDTSSNDFTGYHGAFAGVNAAGNAVDIHYAIIAYPGGRNGTAQDEGFNTARDDLTVTASHEVAEAATDPNVDYKQLGWYDDPRDGEIGDFVTAPVILGNLAVQKLINQQGKAISPAGATPYHFVGDPAPAPGNAATADASAAAILFIASETPARKSLPLAEPDDRNDSFEE